MLYSVQYGDLFFYSAISERKEGKIDIKKITVFAY